MENKQQNSGFLNGFVIGLMVGVGLALLFTTKKGRRIVRMLSDEGLERVGSLDELVQKFQRVTDHATSAPEEEIDETGEDYVKPEKKKVLIADAGQKGGKTVALPQVQINPTPAVTEPDMTNTEVGNALTEALKKIDADLADSAPIEEEEEAPKVKPTRRRFFRGIPKRG